MNQPSKISGTEDSVELMRRQHASIPVRNAAVDQETGEGGAVRLHVPLRDSAWRGLLGGLLPFAKERQLELDALGEEVLGWCDGRATVGDLIERHRQRHLLSFFESRAMLLSFFELMMRRGVLVMKVDDAAPGGRNS